jgi:hypothetical protein
LERGRNSAFIRAKALELQNRRDAPLGVALAEHPREVRLHEALVIDGSFR